MPLFLWPALAVACLLILAAWDTHKINERAANRRAIEAERIAREASAPLGNAERIW